MKLKWYGHSSFLLTSEEGTRVLIDPFNKFLGYRQPSVEVDILTVTHDHRDHNQIQVATGSYLMVHRPESYEKNGISVHGVPTFHDKVEGKKRGSNIVFTLQIDGISVCHCGDLGHLLSEEQIQAIGPVDVLIVPAGGGMTLNGAEAAQVIKQLNPKIAIPMHYRTKALGLVGRLLFDKADKFIAASGCRHVELKELELTKESLSGYTGQTVVTLQYQQQ
ncbi:MBL fold metallo-hydrolase [Paenibacillus protaetiae]|uniref:MBL fold metallo-hydrolase n=1 Tax=Paenibacillus protaetiae TaxID=2509456 RepID=A0A4V0YF51_9BACL|nr:MBL fold metallo-hydrolase [Paenibacillus protaetiae]QAY66491.1 MBL fold metallo-hydrolase [Paenibacillus protaetiae]